MDMRFALLTLAGILVAVIVACDNGGGEPTPSPAASPTPTDGASATPTVTPTAPPSVCLPNPDPASPDVTRVDSPASGDSLASPIKVSGGIAAFEAQFKVTIYDSDGSVIADAIGRSEEGQVLSPFSADLFFDVAEPTAACVWVYDVSAADGTTPVNVAQVPVTLLPGGTPDVCLPNPDPATPAVQVIDEPGPGETLTSPVTISGRVVAFENTYQVAIFDAAGEPVVETFGTAEGGEIGQLNPFSIDVAFTVEEPTPACIWVYEASARDGSPVNVGQTPVTLTP